jgi:hypothetical protein
MQRSYFASDETNAMTFAWRQAPGSPLDAGTSSPNVVAERRRHGAVTTHICRGRGARVPPLLSMRQSLTVVGSCPFRRDTAVDTGSAAISADVRRYTHIKIYLCSFEVPLPSNVGAQLGAWLIALQCYERHVSGPRWSKPPPVRGLAATELTIATSNGRIVSVVSAATC